MKYEEAIGWLKGERSMCNSFGTDDESQARLSEADAGCTQQAYWTVRAYKEGLIPEKKQITVEEIATIISEAGFLRGFDEEEERFDIAETIYKEIKGE